MTCLQGVLADSAGSLSMEEMVAHFGLSAVPRSLMSCNGNLLDGSTGKRCNYECAT